MNNEDELIKRAIASTPPSSRASAKKSIPLIVNALQEEGILDPNTLAYALATVQHETAESFSPVNEGYYNDAKYGYEPGFTGRSSALKNGYSGGENYYGRGFIQLTHDYNYKKFGERLGLGDALVKNPEMANDPAISARILAAFMKDNGVAELAQKGDFYNARAPINSKDYDSYQRIADTANSYKSALTPPMPPEPFEKRLASYKGSPDQQQQRLLYENERYAQKQPFTVNAKTLQKLATLPTQPTVPDPELGVREDTGFLSMLGSLVSPNKVVSPLADPRRPRGLKSPVPLR